MNTNLSLAIIGGGGAAVNAVKAIRQRGYHGEINLFSDNCEPPFNPMLLTYYLAGKIPLKQCYIAGDDFAFLKNYGVNLHHNSPVVELNVKEKIIQNAKGEKVEYKACLISSGASAILPNILGCTSKNTFTFRTIEDVRKLREILLTKPQRVLIVGASMVGVKLIEIFSEAGSVVYLADLASQVFPLAAHPDCAKLIQVQLEKKGIILLLNTKVEAIEDGNHGSKVSFNGVNKDIEVYLIVFCIGVKSNLSFTTGTGLIQDRGIIVDKRMETSEKGIYAAGDVAQGLNLLNQKNEVIPLWANACKQGQIAGVNMAGGQALYSGSIPQNITHFFDSFFVSIGDIQNDAEVEIIQPTNKESLYLFRKHGKIIGINLFSMEKHNLVNTVGVYRQNLVTLLTNSMIGEEFWYDRKYKKVNLYDLRPANAMWT